MQLHFRSYGAGSPLVILHGLFGSLENWHTISARLGAHFQMFALDLRNHGQSPHSTAMDYTVMADDLREFLEQHDLKRADILGHSMGGKVAMEFAALYPDRVHRLIIVDIAPKAYPPSHRQILDALLSLDLARFDDRREIETALQPQIPDLALRRFLLKSLTRLPNGAFAWKLNLPAINHNYPKLNAALNWSPPIQKPTLFIRGAKSDYIQDTDQELIHRLFTNAEIRTIENAGHWVHAEAPEPFLKILQDFLTLHL